MVGIHHPVYAGYYTTLGTPAYTTVTLLHAEAGNEDAVYLGGGPGL